MANEKAPHIFSVGGEQYVKGRDSNGFLLVDNSIMYKIYQKTASKSKAQLGVMMLLLGCAQDGSFSLSLSTAMKRLGISKATYYKILGELDELGLIDWVREKSITIRFDNILRESPSVDLKTMESSSVDKESKSPNIDQSTPVYKKQSPSVDQSMDIDLKISPQMQTDYPEIKQSEVENLFISPIYLNDGLVKNGNKIFRIVYE